MNSITETFFDGLSSSQLGVIDSILSTAIAEDAADRDPQQIHDIVPVEEWLNYRHFMGPFSKSLYPYWKERLPIYINSGSPELVLSGSIGGGKTFFALICCIRKLYELSCFRYPQRLFGLSDISDIFFAYLSINYKHAERTGYGQLRSMLDEIPYFQKDFPRDDKIDSILKFPARIGIIPGTDNLSVISMNLYGCIDDEADFHRQGATSAFGDVQKAAAIYREVTDRRVSRFMVKGKDPGFSAIISSASFQSSFVAQRIKKAKENKSCVFISRLWDVQPEKYSPERFWVFKGTDKKDAFVVNSLNDVIDIAPPEIQSKISERALASDSTGDILIGDVIKTLPEKFLDNFLNVPTDFRPSFSEDIYGALRNLGGVAVSPTGKLFSSRAVWRMCVDTELRHPFTKQTFSVTVRGKDHVLDFFRPDILFDEVAKGKWRLKRHPNAPRFAHIDQSVSKDRTGIAIVHISEYVTDRDTMLVVPKIETDLKVAIFAPPNEKIMIAKCRKFIFDLRAMGMMFGKVTYDQYQSTDSIQIMEVNGIPSANLSVDRDDRAYLQFTNLLYETRISFYEYSIFENEFFELDHDPVAKKVDHPEKGSKDVCDAMVGATFNALESLSGLPHTSNEDVVSSIITDVTPTKEVQENQDWLYSDYKGFERPGEEKKKLKIIGMVGGEQFGGSDGAIFTGRTFM